VVCDTREGRTNAYTNEGPSAAKPPKADYTPSYTAKASNETRKRAAEPQPASDSAKRSSLYTEFSWSPAQRASERVTSGQAGIRSTSVVDLCSEDEAEAEAEAVTNAHAPNTEANSRTAPAPDIEMVFWVPNVQGGGTWRSLSSGPSSLGQAIMANFDAVYRNTEAHIRDLNAMVRFPGRYLDLESCTNIILYHRLRKDSTWIASSGDKHKACYSCIRASRVCVRLRSINDTVKMAIFPLLEQYAHKKLSTEMAYWVTNEYI
jgi:hypothetical protein